MADIRSEKKNVTVHSAVFDEKDIYELLVREVGLKAGVPWHAPFVTFRVYSTAAIGGSGASVSVEITHDHDAEAKACGK